MQLEIWKIRIPDCQELTVTITRLTLGLYYSDYKLNDIYAAT